MNDHLFIRAATMSTRANKVTTGERTYEFNTAAPEATLGITSHGTAFRGGVLGCSISGQSCSAGNYVLYPDARFQPGHAEPTRFRSGFKWRPQVNLERSWGIWIPTNARWPSTRTRRMEPGASSGEGLAFAHR